MGKRHPRAASTSREGPRRFPLRARPALTFPTAFLARGGRGRAAGQSENPANAGLLPHPTAALRVLHEAGLRPLGLPMPAGHPVSPGEVFILPSGNLPKGRLSQGRGHSLGPKPLPGTLGSLLALQTHKDARRGAHGPSDLAGIQLFLQLPDFFNYYFSLLL